jgi:DNA-binding NtrC family response regulator
MNKRILVISSSNETVSSVKDALLPLGYKVSSKQRLALGVKAMRGDELVLLDLPESENSLREIKSYHPEAVILLLGGRGCHGKAAEEGAYDCLERPLDAPRLKVVARNAIHYMFLKEELERRMRSETPKLILGTNIKMMKALKQAERLSSKDSTLLIMGERGTGKELVAKAMHLGSYRASRPFITVDASGDNLDMQLFGTSSAPGALMMAEGGTVFLKEIIGIEESEDERVLMFLREGKFMPHGSAGPVKADARVICSVNGTGLAPRFLRSFPSVVKLPSLRERPEDILPLAEQFLSESAELFNTGSMKLSKEASRALLKHGWPGNVGELKNAMRRACLLARDSRVDVRHLALEGGIPYYSVKEFLEGKLKKYIKNMAKLRNSGLHNTVISEVEKSLIELVLEETGGNQLKAAAALGINRTTLRTKIKNYKIRKKT